MHFVQTQGAKRRVRRNRIEELRISRGLLRSQVAGALLVDQSTVYRWEHQANVPDDKKFALAELLGVDVPFLMGWTDRSEA